MQYLTDLECPFSAEIASVATYEIMDWLLHYAVDLAYTDNGEHLVESLLVTCHAVDSAAFDWH